MTGFRIVIALSLLMATACARDHEVAKRKYLSSGDSYAGQKKYAEAVVEYRNAIKEDVRFGEARFKLAETYAKLGQGAAALGEYVRAADLMPDNTAAHLRAAQMLLLAGQFLDAQAWADKILARDPKNVEAQVLKGSALANLKDLDGAIQQVESAIQQDPTHSDSYAELGIFESARGNVKEAEAAFRKAVETNPKSIMAQLALANFLWMSARPQDAEQILKDAHAIDPDNVEVNRATAAFYLASGRARDAEVYLKAFTDLSKDDANRLLLAEYYIRMNRTPEAQTILTETAKGTGVQAALANVQLAGIAVRSNRRADAYQLIDQALAKQKNNPTALISKAQLLLEDKRISEALETAKTAAAVDPESPLPQVMLGRIYFAGYEYRDADTAYNEALRLSPRMVGVQVELGRVHLAEGNVTFALQDAQIATKAQPNSAEAQLLLARAFLAKGDAAGAETPIRLLASGAPESAMVLTQVGRLQMLKHDREGARTVFERALSLDPNQVEALAGLASLDLQAGKPASARDRIEQRVNADPHNAALLMLAARAYTAMNDSEAAERKLREVIALDDSNLAAYQMLGGLYSSQQRLDDARHEFEILAKRRPSAVGPPTMVGAILEYQHKIDEAKVWYERVLRIDPGAAVAANNLAWLSAERDGNLDVALGLAQTAKSKLPDSPQVNDTLGWIYYKKGLPALAISALEQSVQNDPKSALYHYHLGLAYAKTGQNRKARESLQRALTLNPKFEGSADAQRTLASLRG